MERKQDQWIRTWFIQAWLCKNLKTVKDIRDPEMDIKKIIDQDMVHKSLAM